MTLGATSELFAHSSPEREIQAYENGLLSDIGGAIPMSPSLRAAEHYGLSEVAGLGTILWVEDLSTATMPPWEDSMYLQVARHLGHFNGTWELNPPQRQDWFLADGFTSRIGNPAERYQLVFNNLDDRLVKRTVPVGHVEKLNHLGRAIPAAVSMLNDGPTPLSHVDSQPRNLFPMQLESGETETVLIDWASVGYAPLGTDAAHLVGSSLTWCEMEPEHGAYLHTQTLNSYLEGLEEVGWSGNENLVRLAYMTAAIARSAANLTFTAMWLDSPDFDTGISPIPKEEKSDQWRDVMTRVYPLFEKELANSGL